MTILKDLKSYFQTHAQNEKDDLMDDDILPVVIDGDAGGGHFFEQKRQVFKTASVPHV